MGPKSVWTWALVFCASMLVVFPLYQRKAFANYSNDIAQQLRSWSTNHTAPDEKINKSHLLRKLAQTTAEDSPSTKRAGIKVISDDQQVKKPSDNLSVKNPTTTAAPVRLKEEQGQVNVQQDESKTSKRSQQPVIVDGVANPSEQNLPKPKSAFSGIVDKIKEESKFSAQSPTKPAEKPSGPAQSPTQKGPSKSAAAKARTSTTKGASKTQSKNPSQTKTTKKPGYNCPKTPEELKKFNPKRNLTALISAPGSGNSWVRHLLQTATGYQTGSVYGDKFMYTHGFPGEKTNDGSVVAIKDHFFSCPGKKNRYSKAVIIIRHPIHAALAEFNREKTKHGNQTGLVPTKDFITNGWDKFARNYFNRWMGTYECVWRTFPNASDRCVLHYETLTEGNIFQELDRCLTFIGFPLTPAKINCLMKALEGKYHRPPRPQKDIDLIFYPFEEQELKLMDDAEQLYLERLRSHDYHFIKEPGT